MDNNIKVTREDANGNKLPILDRLVYMERGGGLNVEVYGNHPTQISFLFDSPPAGTETFCHQNYQKNLINVPQNGPGRRTNPKTSSSHMFLEYLEKLRGIFLKLDISMHFKPNRTLVGPSYEQNPQFRLHNGSFHAV